MEIIYIKECYT